MFKSLRFSHQDTKYRYYSFFSRCLPSRSGYYVNCPISRPAGLIFQCSCRCALRRQIQSFSGIASDIDILSVGEGAELLLEIDTSQLPCLIFIVIKPYTLILFYSQSATINNVSIMFLTFSPTHFEGNQFHASY